MAVARTIVLRQLASAPRTRAELAATLRKRDVPEDAARHVLDRYAELGYVDDAALAATWARARVADRGLGKRAVAAGLRSRGVEDEHVAAALADVSAEDEEEAARRLVRKRLTASGGLDREVLQRRLLAMLARKGHPPGSALRVIRDELERAGLTRDGASRAGRRAGRDVDGDLQVDRDPGDGDLGDGDLGDGDLGDGDLGDGDAGLD